MRYKEIFIKQGIGATKSKRWPKTSCLKNIDNKTSAAVIRRKGVKMKIEIKQQQKTSYDPNLASEEFITMQLNKAVKERLTLGTLNGNQGFISFWFRVDKSTNTIQTKGALVFKDREIAEEDFNLNKKILDSARDALYIYAVGAYFIIHLGAEQHVVKTVLLHAEGLETF